VYDGVRGNVVYACGICVHVAGESGKLSDDNGDGLEEKKIERERERAAGGGRAAGAAAAANPVKVDWISAPRRRDSANGGDILPCGFHEGRVRARARAWEPRVYERASERASERSLA